MPNPHHKCPDCGLNHRPLNCRKGGVLSNAPVPRGIVEPDGASSPSRVILAVDITPITSRLDDLIRLLAPNPSTE